MNGKRVFVIGTGQMATEYIKVLNDLGSEVVLVSRSKEKANKYLDENENINISSVTCDLSNFHINETDFVINAVAVEALFSVAKKCLNIGFNNILIEKPGFLNLSEGKELLELSKQNKVSIYLGYNRRMYGSVIQARDAIEQDGGLQSIFFDFTEWADEIGLLPKSNEALKKWVLSNSTHVVDLAFHLAGLPRSFHAFSKGGVKWHPSSSTFAGAGITERKVLFNYMANWDSAGRWRLELHTKERKLILAPMEILQYTKRGSIKVFEAETDELDKKFKPGLWRQVVAFLKQQPSHLCTLEEQLQLFPTYKKIAGYR
jgi:predicted dehydrogenase